MIVTQVVKSIYPYIRDSRFNSLFFKSLLYIKIILTKKRRNIKSFNIYIYIIYGIMEDLKEKRDGQCGVTIVAVTLPLLSCLALMIETPGLSFLLM